MRRIVLFFADDGRDSAFNLVLAILPYANVDRLFEHTIYGRVYPTSIRRSRRIANIGKQRHTKAVKFVGYAYS